MSRNEKEPRISYGKNMAIKALSAMAAEGMTKADAVKRMVADGASGPFCYEIIKEYGIKFRGQSVSVSTKIDEETFRDLKDLALRLGRGVDDIVAAGIEEMLVVHGSKRGVAA